MSFVSLSFAVLYLVALALRLACRGHRRPLLVGLLLLSWAFYAWHVPWYLALIVFSTAVDYLAALRIATLEETRVRARRATLAVSVLVNLGLLGWFKYAGFVTETVTRVAEALGVEGLALAVPEAALPIGISFYTFQSMSYTLDVYRGGQRAERSFLRVACYVAFFPQLVAGPIVRAGAFLYQLDRRRRFRARVVLEGLWLVVRGLFLKMVVADNLGRIVDAQWPSAAGDSAEGTLALAVLVFFAGQLFCDFAGYSSIARGVAYTLGFRLPLNFDAPYLATTFREFWRRWHISLSTWMRDYLYVPLGGNRKGRARGVVNLFVVLVLSGLWHGAAWTFVLWGAVHGLALAVERVCGIGRRHRSPWLLAPWFLVVQGTWVLSMGLFRAQSLSEAVAIVRNALIAIVRLPTAGLGAEVGDGLVGFGWWLVVPIVVLHLRTLATERLAVPSMSPWEKAVVSGAMLAAIVMLYSSSRQFLYFQF